MILRFIDMNIEEYFKDLEESTGIQNAIDFIGSSSKTYVYNGNNTIINCGTILDNKFYVIEVFQHAESDSYWMLVNDTYNNLIEIELDRVVT